MEYIRNMIYMHKYDLSKNPENIHRTNTINMYILYIHIIIL